jgi:serine/threonine protein kinase
MAVKCPECQTENTSDSQFCKKCATPLPLTEEIPVTKTLETPVKRLARGTIFADRYEVLEELGKGGMGEVYKVRDKKLDEDIALKVLKPEIAADKGRIERFKNELKFARKIAHRNVCKMYDLNEEEETPYITMEYVKGEDLKSFIRKKERLKEKEVIAIAKEVCEGLVEAHRLGVVHRDLKPQNIMIDDKSNAKVMDFGIARSIEAPGVTQSGVIIGTPDYMSPEQAEGEEADQRSDIYALGVILYEMITGSVPFKGDTAFSVALKHKSKLPHDPKKLNPDVSDDFSRLILICMEKERERRYQTAEGLLNDLRNLEDGLPLGTKLRPRRETFFAALIRKKLFIPSVVVALAIIAVATWQLLPEKGAVSLTQGKPSIAVLPFKDMSPQKDQEYFCDGLTGEIIFDLSQVSDLLVRSRRSAMTYKGTNKSIREIGKELNVQYALEGSIQKAGNNLSITAELIDTKNDAYIWAEKYSGTLDDYFDIQEKVSQEIFNTLKLQLSPKESSAIAKRSITNIHAYDCYLRARSAMLLQTEEGHEDAIRHLESGLSITGENALLYAGLAYAYFWPGNISQAEFYAGKALELDPDLALAHMALGSIYCWLKFDVHKGLRSFKKAAEIDPSDWDTQFHLAIFYISAGQMSLAMKCANRLVELDPTDPFSLGMVSYIHTLEGRIKLGLETIQQAGLDLNNAWHCVWMAWTLTMAKQHQDALAILEPINTRTDNEGMTILCKLLYSALKEDHRRCDQLLTPDFVSWLESASCWWVADFLALAGNKERSFELFELAVERGFFNYPFLKDHDPFVENIRSDPRFKKLLERVKHEWENFEI